MPACRPISSRVSPSSARRWATRRPKSPRTSLGSCVLPIVPPNFVLYLVPAPTRKWVRPKKDIPIVDLLVSAQVAVEALGGPGRFRSEEHTSELQSRFDLVCRLLLEK